jgi:serine/threonine protein kinase
VRAMAFSDTKIHVLFGPNTVVDDKYRIIEQIGEGGMGSVFRAIEPDLQRTVAVKILRSDMVDDQHRKRFSREGRVLAALSHPNLIQFYTFGFCQNSWPYIAMEFFPGKSVRSLVEDGGPMTVKDALGIFMQVCDAMEYAHQNGIVHRDLSPNNIMLGEHADNELAVAKVIDFGLSAFLPVTSHETQSLTGTGMVIGSLYYMSPEQCAGQKADARSDIYSLGCVLYQALTGSPPFDTDTPLGLMRMHASESPKRISARVKTQITAGMEHAIFRAMAKDPEDRYQSMNEFKADLQLIATGEGCQIPAPKSLWKTSQLNNKLLSGIIAAGVAVVALMAILSSKRDAVPEKETFDSSPSQTMRRLRSKGELKGKSPAEKINYYRAWLTAHGQKDSLDQVEARAELANQLKVDQPIEALRLRQSALEMTDRVFNEAIGTGNGDDADRAAFMTVSLFTDLEARKEVVGNLQAKIDRIEAAGKTGFLRAYAECKREIGLQLYLNKAYEKSLQCYEEAEASAEAGSIIMFDKAECKLARARCLRALNRKKEATKLLLQASKMVNESESSFRSFYNKHELLQEAFGQQNYELCDKFADRAEAFYAKENLTSHLMNALYIHFKALDALHAHEKIFQVFAKYSNNLTDPIDRMRLWQMLARHNLNSTPRRNDDLQRLLKDNMELWGKTKPIPPLEAMFVLTITAAEYYERNERQAALQFLRALNVNAITVPAEEVDNFLPSAVQYSALIVQLGDYQCAEKTLRKFLSALPEGVEPYKAQLLNAHLSNTLCYLHRNAEALKVLEPGLQIKPESSSEAIVAINCKMAAARILHREFKREADALKLIDEAESVTKDFNLRYHEAECFVERGIICNMKGNYAQANDEFSKSEQLMREFPKRSERLLMWQLKNALDQKNNDQAGVVAGRYLQLYKTSEPGYIRALTAYGDVCKRRNDLKNAARVTEELNKLRASKARP